MPSGRPGASRVVPPDQPAIASDRGGTYGRARRRIADSVATSTRADGSCTAHRTPNSESCAVGAGSPASRQESAFPQKRFVQAFPLGVSAEMPGTVRLALSEPQRSRLTPCPRHVRAVPAQGGRVYSSLSICGSVRFAFCAALPASLVPSRLSRPSDTMPSAASSRSTWLNSPLSAISCRARNRAMVA